MIRGQWGGGSGGFADQLVDEFLGFGRRVAVPAFQNTRGPEDVAGFTQLNNVLVELLIGHVLRLLVFSLSRSETDRGAESLKDVVNRWCETI